MASDRARMLEAARSERLWPRPPLWAIGLGVAGAAFLLAYPFLFKTPFSHHLMILILLYALMAQSWNVVAGLSGQISLGHAIFFGIGAYSSTVLFIKFGITPWIGLLVGMAISALAAIAIGVPTLRLRGHYFAIATLLIGSSVQIIVQRWDWVGAASGLYIPINRTAPWFYLQFHTSKVPYYYLALGAAALAYLLVWRIRRSRFGFRLQALRDEPDAAASLGIAVARHKVHGVHDLGRHDVGRRHLLRPIRAGARSRAPAVGRHLHHRPAHDRARRQRHAVGPGARRGHPDPAVRVQPHLVRRHRPHHRPHHLRPLDPGRVHVAAERHPEPVRGAHPAPRREDVMTILLDVKGVTKRYGGLTANSDITFDVNQGEILGIIGPNGAGKSTLFDLITGFQPLDAGRVFLDGHDITGLRPDRIASRGVARTFQKLKPFPDLTVTENVIVGALVRTGDMKQARDHALEALAFTDLLEKRNHFARELSTGQRKRLELARGLAMKPRMILMDEVTGGVDQRTIPGLVDLVLELKRQGVTIVTIEHNMQVMMRISDRILALYAGRRIAFGKPEEVRQDPAVVDAYLGTTTHAA